MQRVRARLHRYRGFGLWVGGATIAVYSLAGAAGAISPAPERVATPGPIVTFAERLGDQPGGAGQQGTSNQVTVGEASATFVISSSQAYTPPNGGLATAFAVGTKGWK